MRIRDVGRMDLSCPPRQGTQALTLSWLGQAGWLLRAGSTTVVIDPYLSDSLARKYEGTRYPHIRLHEPPVAADALRDVDVILCSHRHTDHMDAQTLRAIMAASPEATLVVPEAWSTHASAFGIDPSMIVGAREDRPLKAGGILIDPVLAAHETIERDALGRSLYLGYVLELGGVRVYHSGDCVPYDGQAAAIRRRGVDIAILPVNGRDLERRSGGVPGNFHPEEAVALAEDVGAQVLIASHFGLFDFNTVDQSRLDSASSAWTRSDRFLQPTPGHSYEVTYR